MPKKKKGINDKKARTEEIVRMEIKRPTKAKHPNDENGISYEYQLY